MSTNTRITLATLPQARAQEVFDQVAHHLLTQRKKSRRRRRRIVGGSCAYRGNEGRSCAAGCLISDEEYQTAMEGVSWQGLSYDLGIVPAAHAELIAELQAIHDTFPPSRWAARLKQVAQRRVLSPAVIEEFSAKENV